MYFIVFSSYHVLNFYARQYLSISVHRKTIYRAANERKRERKKRDRANGTHPRLWLSVLSEASSVTESCVRGPWVTSTPMLPKSNVA